MLTTEEIKKACVFAEGFEYQGNGIVDRVGNKGSRYSSRSMNCVGADLVYPLFLQRVIEGINKRDYYRIWQRHNDILVDNNHHTMESFLHNNKNIDNAKEEAIRYILKEIK